MCIFIFWRNYPSKVKLYFFFWVITLLTDKVKGKCIFKFLLDIIPLTGKVKV